MVRERCRPLQLISRAEPPVVVARPASRRLSKPLARVRSARLADVPSYKNFDGTVPNQGLGDVFKWQVADRIAGKRRRERAPFTTPRRENDVPVHGLRGELRRG